jgi:hypothetical protein
MMMTSFPLSWHPFILLVTVWTLLSAVQVSSFAQMTRVGQLANHPRPFVWWTGQQTFDTPLIQPRSPPNSSSELLMAYGDDNGPSLGAQITAGFLLVLFVAGSTLPLLDGTGGGRDLSVSRSVVTQQDTPPNSISNKNDRLSRSSIQERLSSLPVFYLTTKDGIDENIYMSYKDALDAANGSDNLVKATSLDQVMYVPPVAS